MGLTYRAETSMNNYCHILRNNSKQRRAQLRWGGNLKSQIF